jgi:hypothetical protein
VARRPLRWTETIKGDEATYLALITIVFEYGLKVGMGHMRRMECVAKALVEQNVEVAEIVLSTSGIGVESFVLPDLCTCVIVDVTLPLLAELIPVLNEFRARGGVLIGIDTARHLNTLFDLVWVPSMFVEPEFLADNLVSGWDTYLFTRSTVQWKYSDTRRIGIVTGSSDHLNLFNTYARELQNSFPLIDFIWLKGPFASWNELSVGHFVEGISPVDLSQECDLLACVFGVSAIEVMSTGCPVVIIENGFLSCIPEYNCLKSVGISVVGLSSLWTTFDHFEQLRSEAYRATALEIRDRLSIDGAMNLVRHIQRKMLS